MRSESRERSMAFVCKAEDDLAGLLDPAELTNTVFENNPLKLLRRGPNASDLISLTATLPTDRRHIASR